MTAGPVTLMIYRLASRFTSDKRGILMFAIVAAVLFGVALILDIANVAGAFGWLVTAGLLCLALHFALGVSIPWRRQP
jgi:hypothetical protein